jgi:azurin
LFIEVDGDALKFSNLTSDVPNAAQRLEGSFRVGNGTQVVLDFQNVSTINQHNWVLVKNGTKDAVAARGIEAGAINDWLQPGDSDVIANTKLLVTGGKAVIRFAAPPPGQYQFVCTFPGHNGTMFGDFEVTP